MRKSLLFAALSLFLAAGGPAEEKRFDVPIGDSPSLGPAGAPITMIEFIDFQ